jgi:hypothetical protein
VLDCHPTGHDIHSHKQLDSTSCLRGRSVSRWIGNHFCGNLLSRPCIIGPVSHPVVAHPVSFGQSSSICALVAAIFPTPQFRSTSTDPSTPSAKLLKSCRQKSHGCNLREATPKTACTCISIQQTCTDLPMPTTSTLGGSCLRTESSGDDGSDTTRSLAFPAVAIAARAIALFVLQICGLSSLGASNVRIGSLHTTADACMLSCTLQHFECHPSLHTSASVRVTT